MSATALSDSLTSPLPITWIFAKWPTPGGVKTRLCPPLTPAQAADLSYAFLEDRVHSLAALDGILPGIAFAPDDSESHFRQAFPITRLKSQGDGDLGERMARVIWESFGEGHPAVLLLGSDLPLLTASTIAEAATLLTENACDLVLTPSLDGGYGMIGVNAPHAFLFDAMAWSTPEVLPETLRRADEAGLRVRLTDPVPDCDTPEDLRDLLRRLRTDPEAVRARAPRTVAFLLTLPDPLD